MRRTYTRQEFSVSSTERGRRKPMVRELPHNRNRAETVRGVATILAVFVASLFYLTICMNRNVNVYDEGFILFDATRILDGDIPHRDFYTIYGPGQIYVLAILYKIFGISVLVERAWDTIVRGLIVVLVLIVVNQAAPRWLALVAAGASLVCLAYFGIYGYPMYPALAASLGGVAFLTQALARRNSFAALTAAGVCAGIATLFRYDVGVALFGGECAILAFSAWHRRRDRGSAMQDAILPLGLFSAGFAVLVVPFAVTFAFAGAIPDILFQVVDYSAKFYARMRGLPFPRPWSASGDLTSLAVYLPLGCCVAAVPAMIAIARRRNTDGVAEKSERPQVASTPILPWAVLTLVVISLLFFAKASVRGAGRCADAACAWARPSWLGHPRPDVVGSGRFHPVLPSYRTLSVREECRVGTGSRVVGAAYHRQGARPG
jgi:hypothetical protein